MFCYPNAGLPNAMGGYDQKGPEMAEEVRSPSAHLQKIAVLHPPSLPHTSESKRGLEGVRRA